MDWNRVQGSWKQLEGKMKAKWASLLLMTSPPSTGVVRNSKARFNKRDGPRTIFVSQQLSGARTHVTLLRPRRGLA
jgi:hypothetical protein